MINKLSWLGQEHPQTKMSQQPIIWRQHIITVAEEDDVSDRLRNFHDPGDHFWVRTMRYHCYQWVPKYCSKYAKHSPSLQCVLAPTCVGLGQLGFPQCLSPLPVIEALRCLLSNECLQILSIISRNYTFKRQHAGHDQWECENSFYESLSVLVAWVHLGAANYCHSCRKI